jgi:putative membrane protein
MEDSGRALAVSKESGMRISLTAVALICGSFAIQAFAQTTSIQDFVSKVAVSDMFEIQSSKLAAQKGNENIRAFAQQMITDHTKTTNELKWLVGKAKLPNGMDAEHQKKLDQLQKLGADKFDATYASMQVQAHEEAVKLFETYASTGDDAQLKAWAAKTLPALKEHLQHAKALK